LSVPGQTPPSLKPYLVRAAREIPADHGRENRIAGEPLIPSKAAKIIVFEKWEVKKKYSLRYDTQALDSSVGLTVIE